MSRRILVITYPYPPMPSTGANRWAAMAKYLRRAGHQVTVLTTSAFGTLRPEEEEGVVRTGDLIANEALRRLARRPPLPRPGGEVPTDRPPPGLFTRVIVPDMYLATWVPGAARMARHLETERHFDCVVTTSPYESTHLVARALGRARPPWVADFRDAWVFEPYRDPFPTAPQRALDRRLERLVVCSADAVAAVHRTLADDFRSRYGVDAAYVPNGWDPDLDAAVEETEAIPAGDDRVSLVHTGTLWGGWGRDPEALFAALRRLRSESPEAAAKLELVLAGRLDTREERLLAEAGLDRLLTYTGPLSRASAMALQRGADALLLLTSRRLSWEAPGKLFEYLAAGRPILALAEGNEAARVVRETQTGVTVAPDDPGAIAAALLGLVEGRLAEAHRPVGLERYRYPAPAEAMAGEVERAIASARP